MTDIGQRSDTEALQRNLSLLPRYSIASSWLPWQPIIALFVTESFGVDTLLTLTAIMYFGVVVAEVPSGWMSDRLGRVITLRVAALLWVVGLVVLLVSPGSFVLLAIGQVFMAMGFAAMSGTDVSFHYDTLEALGIEEEFEVRQSHLKSLAYLSVALSAVAGGAVGLLDLRLAFVLSLIVVLWQLLLVSQFQEPPRSGGPAPGFAEQLRSCARYLRRPLLRWILLYWVAMVLLEHAAHTLSQPYLTEALGQSPQDLGATSLVVGLIFASFGIGGSAAAAATPAIRRRLGFFGALLAFGLVSAFIVSAMALVIALPVAILLVFRSVQGAAAPIVLTAAVAPLVDQAQRATYLSLHSLAGRLFYGSLLFGISRAVGDSLDASLTVLSAVSWGAIALVVVAWIASPSARAEVAGSPGSLPK